ncbi:hypothetical protein ACFSZS_30085 [Seohaeicola zhoushanensis]
MKQIIFSGVSHSNLFGHHALSRATTKRGFSTMDFIKVPQMTSEERELGRRGPAVYRTTNIEFIDVEVDDVKISSHRLAHEHRAPEVHLCMATPNGLIRYHRADELEDWTFLPRRKVPTALATEADVQSFVDSMIPALILLPEHLPEANLPQSDSEPLDAEDRLLLAEASKAALTPAHDRHTRCLAGFANLIRKARARDLAKKEEKARRKRMKRQFDSLPAGTFLLQLGFDNRIAVVSDVRGRKTLRSVNIYSARFGAWNVDFTLRNLEDYFLFSGPSSRQLERGLLSAHQLMTALSQAKALGPTCPDLVI